MTTLDRRRFLQGLAAGAATLLSGGLALDARAGAEAFNLPDLGYPVDALEPIIDARTMTIHHGKHHAAYVAGLNRVMTAHPDLAQHGLPALLADGAAAVPAAVRQSVIDAGGGHANHSLFWRVLGPREQLAGSSPTERLAGAIQAAFKDLAGLRQAMTEAGMKRFGSGWSWLVKDEQGRLDVLSTANQDSPLMMPGKTPLLGIDVWEHAYYLKYENRRAEYLAAIWQVVDWTAVSRRYEGGE
jgi:Fe-Mn family superoxide dismutase